MARSIREIQAAIIAAKDSDPILGTALTSTSQVAIWRLWTYVVAVCQWTLERLFDVHKDEVTDIIAKQKPHSLQWYVTMAKAFQYGVLLPADSDNYAIVPPADPSVLIISNAAAVELTNLVRIKAAKISGGTLGALSTGELAAFAAYMAKIKDAGVRLECRSDAADVFLPTMVIYYDPLVLKSDGSRIDGTSVSPVKDAVNVFLDSLPFNGVFILNSFIAAMQAVPGVMIANVEHVQAISGSLPADITVKYIPVAGYMALDGVWFDAHVSYVPYSILS